MECVRPQDGTASVALARVGVVAIGRNEGRRLHACIASLPHGLSRVVYVDSGSTDASVSWAETMGLTVVRLDASAGFTAARARNAGAAELFRVAPHVRYIQFIDGDCELSPGFIEAALGELERDEGLAVVCGRRRERYPNRTIYNRLCDMEWDMPSGDTAACGGDALVRAEAFLEVGGYAAALIAGEEPEMCLRMRRLGYGIRRIATDMTLHDADVRRLAQWWTRSVRAGHAYAEVFHRHLGSRDRIWGRELSSAVLLGLVLPGAATALAPATLGMSFGVFGVHAAVGLRAFMRRVDRGARVGDAALYGGFCVLAKFAEAAGAARYARSWLRGLPTRLIEYKDPSLT
jgi:GT2 family glycosyltransferase